MSIRAIALGLPIIFCGTISCMSQEDSAPFGLEWLAAPAELAELGVVLTPIEVATFGESFAATNLPKGLSDIGAVVLSFGYDNRLWRVAALSNEFDNDRYGSQAKARYEQLASSLAKSYAIITSSHRASTDSYYGKPENFAYGISRNEAFWYSVYASPSAEIELSIGSNHQNTYWRLIYTHNEGGAMFEASKADAELDAL